MQDVGIAVAGGANLVIADIEARTTRRNSAA